MKRRDPELKYELKVLNRIEPAYISRNEEIVIVLKNSIRDVRRYEPKFSAIVAFTDMKWFKNVASAALYGPGELVQAHTANEYVEVDDLVTALKTTSLQ